MHVKMYYVELLHAEGTKALGAAQRFEIRKTLERTSSVLDFIFPNAFQYMFE